MAADVTRGAAELFARKLPYEDAKAATEAIYQALTALVQQRMAETVPTSGIVASKSVYQALTALVQEAQTTEHAQEQEVDAILARVDAGIAEEKKAMSGLLTQLRTTRIAVAA